MGITLHALDASLHNIAISDGTNTLAIDNSGNIAVTQSGTWDINSITGTVTVDATDLDIRSLSASTDNVSISDGTDTLAIETDGSINVNSVDTGYASWQVAAVSVANTATQIGATPLAARKRCTIQNIGAQNMFVGPANTVTTANGLLIAKGFSQDIELNATATLWGITGSATTDTRFAEYA